MRPFKYIYACPDKIYLDDPSCLEERHLPNLINAIFNINRFNGNLTYNWTVGNHSIIVYELCNYYEQEHLFKAALAHDLHEAIVGDIATPIKQAVPEFRAFEDKWMNRVGELVGVDLSTNPVKYFDTLAMFAEVHFKGSWLWNDIVNNDLLHQMLKDEDLHYLLEKTFLNCTEGDHKLCDPEKYLKELMK